MCVAQAIHSDILENCTLETSNIPATMKQTQTSRDTSVDTINRNTMCIDVHTNR